ncbi:hypothetical protein [Aquabacterium sp.]|uniref:hypothetical protein n=1 Tax=Aquabacterium sp. TaxID=1872578 RepID=UPI003D6D0FD0
MRTPKIKTLVLLGLVGAWALKNQQRRKAKEAGAQASPHTLASLVDDFPDGSQDQKVPTAENPFPKGNPTVIPTGAGPGG